MKKSGNVVARAPTRPVTLKCLGRQKRRRRRQVSPLDSHVAEHGVHGLNAPIPVRYFGKNNGVDDQFAVECRHFELTLRPIGPLWIILYHVNQHARIDEDHLWLFRNPGSFASLP
jgi:hypothetical protein